MQTEILRKNILKTLLYYDIFDHPLKKDEIFNFLPVNSLPKEVVCKFAEDFSQENNSLYSQRYGYFYIKPNSQNILNRFKKEGHSLRMWRITKFVTHIIKRFPFVRAIFVTGSLSKNSSDKQSDLDFMVITKKGRLWITRTLLMLFKKVFLLNSFKYFCINYFITEDQLEIEEKNFYSAIETATVKCVFNEKLSKKFLDDNSWVKSFFPNYVIHDQELHSAGFKINNHISYFQRLVEILFIGKPGDWLNLKLKNMIKKHWIKKYPDMNEYDRNRIFKSTDNISKVHPPDMQTVILKKYYEKLRKYGIDV